ncbi:MAG: FAD-dependent oxidoreductase [Rhodanobacteraceae bacterium]|nr:FAD-dependent oxidoreductase [Rhodanobacteraceae bacterium]
MRIAVVGSGIAGLASAWLLARRHEVVLFEAQARLGGHTHTHTLDIDGERCHVDSGFIVYNNHNYPLLAALFAELGVATQPTSMSFSVQNEASGLEYNAATLDTLFCQRRNLFSPRFWGMLRDLRRFYRLAPALLDSPAPGPTLAEYLAAQGFGQAFRDDHLIPMASALWSSPAAGILQFPARYLVRFMAQHRMLQITGRPEWRVVRGGSHCYVAALASRWRLEVRSATPVQALRRDADGVEVEAGGRRERFDHAVVACHSDEALALLADADTREHEILGAIPYQSNDTILHTDTRLLPRQRKAWAAWNAYVPAQADAVCTVSYWMNRLQNLTTTTPLIVTLNRSAAIDPAKVLRRLHYRHPVYTEAAVAAQTRQGEIQGKRRTWFAGAYWGWGFHEDGLRSAVAVARALGVEWPGAASTTDPDLLRPAA